MDKASLLARVVAELEREHATLVAAQRGAIEAATHEEARAESDKDMRSTEASYLARGQAQRVAALATEIQRLKSLELGTFDAGSAIRAGALVTLRAEGKRSVVFVLPAGAAVRVEPIRVITPVSPLGSALLGAHVGDVVEVERGERLDEYEVVAVE